jgi:hypothetical protein
MKGFRMHLRHLSARALVAAALAAALSCSDATAPDGVNERSPTDLRLLAAPYGTPPLVSTEASFYAVKGKVSGVDIWYRPRAGATDSAKFLEFRLGTASLDRRPDGSLIAAGDSVLIVLSVVDPQHFIGGARLRRERPAAAADLLRRLRRRPELRWEGGRGGRVHALHAERVAAGGAVPALVQDGEQRGHRREGGGYDARRVHRLRPDVLSLRHRR